MDYGLKSIEVLSLWTRPTIHWALGTQSDSPRQRECSVIPLTAVVSNLSSLNSAVYYPEDKYTSGLITIFWTGIVLFCLTVIVGYIENAGVHFICAKNKSNEDIIYYPLC